MEGDAPEENSSGSVYSRYRSPTFSHEEAKALLSIIDKYKTIILNKNTSAAASRSKEVAWYKIAKIFNNQGFKHTRSVNCLKMKWLNLKRDVRKLTNNIMDARADLDDVTKQTVTMMCEAENNTSVVDEPNESDLDFLIDENEINYSQWNGNKDKESDETIDENGCRHRSPVFSQRETKALLNIIDKYKTIILNKSTSSAANRAKDVTWSKIAKIFNRQGFKHMRTPFSLKTKWLNLKKDIKKVCNDSSAAKKTEFDDGIRQLVLAMCEAENNILIVDEPVESDLEFNFIEEIDGEKDSDESIGGDNETDGRLKRSMNFSPEECSMLLQCVKPEKHIVFSKVTSAESNKLKDMAWKRIKQSYNKFSHQKRSTRVLRKKFANMKSRIGKGNYSDLLKDLDVKHHKRENAIEKIKAEPLFECKGDPDLDIHDIDERNGIDHDSHSNHALDPLSTVLSTDSGMSSINLSENKEVVKLKLELYNYKLETAKLQRKRIQELAQSEAADRETKTIESSLRLRAARLEVVAAEMKLPPAHPALAYTPEEERAQHYMHRYQAD